MCSKGFLSSDDPIEQNILQNLKLIIFFTHSLHIHVLLLSNQSYDIRFFLLAYILPPSLPILTCLLIHLIILPIYYIYSSSPPFPFPSFSSFPSFPFLFLFPFPFSFSSFQVKTGDCIMTMFGEEQVTAVNAVMGEGVYTVVTNEVRMYAQYKTAQAKHKNSFFCMMLSVTIN